MTVMDRDRVKQAIKEAADIVAIISQYTTLIPAGRRMKGLSPFTNEKTPSFYVDPEEGLYYCFSSQKGGDVFTFVQEVEGVDFKEALKLLGDRVGIDTQSAPAEKKGDAPLYQILESATVGYQKQLTDEVREYLRSRGISDQSIKEWGIGYAPDAWNTVCSTRMPHLEDAIQSGMCVRKEKSVYDRFRNRIMFPFHDTRGRVIGFSGRAYGDDATAKYINSPESPLFKKSSFLYGLNRAKPAIRRNNMAVLTEGPIDAIMVHQAGYPMTVATSGTAVTDNHLSQLRHLSNRLLLALDGDAAGIRATFRVITRALSAGMDVKVTILPDGSDPADVIAKDANAFKSAVKEACPAVAFVTKHITEKYGKTGEDAIRGVREILLPVIANIRDPLMKDYAIKEAAASCSLDPEAIKQSMKSVEMIARGQTTDNARVVKTRTRLSRRNDAVRETAEKQKKRINNFLRTVSMARAFLSFSNSSLTEDMQRDLQYIEQIEHLPEGNEELAKLRYEELFPADVRVERVREELEDTLKRLCPELRKREEVKKTIQT